MLCHSILCKYYVHYTKTVAFIIRSNAYLFNSRKNHQRAMDSLGASLEAEQRAKTEALRIKRKLESDINELEIALDHSNKANSEGQKAIKRYQGTLRDTIQAYEDEVRSRQQIMESVGISERKANALSVEVKCNIFVIIVTLTYVHILFHKLLYS